MHPGALSYCEWGSAGMKRFLTVLAPLRLRRRMGIPCMECGIPRPRCRGGHGVTILIEAAVIDVLVADRQSIFTRRSV